MGREFELKYRAAPVHLEHVRERFGSFDTIAMEACYFDTPDGALRSMYWMLRRRTENGTAVCTLKTPLPDGSRGEWEVRAATVEEAVPLLLEAGCPAELATLTRPGLTQRCAARFTRLAKKIRVGDSTLELALDSGVFLGGGKEQPFSEMEVELKDGREADCLSFAQALAQEFDLVPEEKSKAQRAFALAGLK